MKYKDTVSGRRSEIYARIASGCKGLLRAGVLLMPAMLVVTLVALSVSSTAGAASSAATSAASPATPSAASSKGATAESTLNKCVARLRDAKGVSASFAIMRSGERGSASGTLKSAGRKFAIVAAAAGAWYDGKTLYTWSKQSGEVTLSTPTATELRDTNPLLYLDAAADFSAAFGKSANASQKVIVMTPKRRGAPARKVTVTLNAASLLPMQLDIVLSNGQTLKVTLKNVSLNSTCPPATFVFPAKKYPGVKQVDLR